MTCCFKSNPLFSGSLNLKQQCLGGKCSDNAYQLVDKWLPTWKLAECSPVKTCNPRYFAKTERRRCPKQKQKVLTRKVWNRIYLINWWKSEQIKKRGGGHLLPCLWLKASPSDFHFLDVSSPKQWCFDTLFTQLPLLTAHQRLVIKMSCSHSTLFHLYFWARAQDNVLRRTRHLENVWNSLPATNNVKTPHLQERGSN